MKVADVLDGVAIGLDAAAEALKDPNEKFGGAASGATRGAAAVIRAVAGLLTDRTPAECVEILEYIRDSGAKLISKGELDAQTDKVIAKAIGR